MKMNVLPNTACPIVLEALQGQPADEFSQDQSEIQVRPLGVTEVDAIDGTVLSVDHTTAILTDIYGCAVRARNVAEMCNGSRLEV